MVWKVQVYMLGSFFFYIKVDKHIQFLCWSMAVVSECGYIKNNLNYFDIGTFILWKKNMVGKFPLLLVGFILCVVYFNRSDSIFKNCAEAGFCCAGTNNSCFGKGPTMSDNSSTGNCYCDEICVKNRDCCIDYLQTCSGNMIAV